jgi:hypothetical protein
MKQKLTKKFPHTETLPEGADGLKSEGEACRNCPSLEPNAEGTSDEGPKPVALIEMVT